MFRLLLATALSTLLSFSPVVNWGLGGFGNDRVPTAPAEGVRLLREYNGLYHVPTTERRVYLTFDLGYEPGFTHEVLDILRENDLKAVFFLCGGYLEEGELINRMITEGHTIGNHTDRHRDLPKLDKSGIVDDIMTLQREFTAKYPHAAAPAFFRPPQGRIDEKTMQVAHENGFRTVMWSIAIKDWSKSPIDHAAAANKIAGRLHPGAIILLHLTNAGMPKTLRTLLPLIKERGYTIGEPAEYNETRR